MNVRKLTFVSLYLHYFRIIFHIFDINLKKTFIDIHCLTLSNNTGYNTEQPTTPLLANNRQVAFITHAN